MNEWPGHGEHGDLQIDHVTAAMVRAQDVAAELVGAEPDARPRAVRTSAS